MSQTSMEPDRGAPPSPPPPLPRWVRGFLIITLVLVLLYGILHLTGNSPGGPGSHMPPTEHRVPAP